MRSKSLVVLMILVWSLLLPMSFAEELGVNIIGTENSMTEDLGLEDIVIGNSYEIPGKMELVPVSFSYVDAFAQYDKGKAGQNDNQYIGGRKGSELVWANTYRTVYFYNMHWNDSGTAGDFAWLMMDVVNLTHSPVKYMDKAEVRMIYGFDGSEYEFGGWVRQANYDYNTEVYRNGDGIDNASFAVLDPSDEEPIGMLYTGNYIFGCTLP